MFKLSPYTKIAIIIAIEEWLLLIIGTIIRIIFKEFDMLYIIVPQMCLLTNQVILVILQRYEEQHKTSLQQILESLQGKI